jgi:hypothetical protein
MITKLCTRLIVILFVFSTIACGGLRFSQADPAAKDYHPKRIAVFPVEVNTYEEARGPLEQIIPGVLIDKKWFTDVIDTASLNRQLQANEDLRKAMTDYLSKLQTLNFSDSGLSQKIGELAKIDAFLLVSVETWNYAVEKDKKVAKVSMGMKLIDATTGKIIWKAGHHITESYMLLKPELSKVARNLASDMTDYMPH